VSLINEAIRIWAAIAGAIVTTLAAISAFFKAHKEYTAYRARLERQKRKSEAIPTTPAPESRGSLYVALAFIAIGVVLLVGSTTLSVIGFSSSKSLSVSISEPGDHKGIAVVTDPNGSSHFVVRGTFSRVAGDSTRRIYLLVHPERPVAPGWWIQPDVALDSEGNWSGIAWFGTKGFEASQGDELWIVAVVGKRRTPLPGGADGHAWVEDPSALQPDAQSKVVHLTVESARRNYP